MVLGQTIGDHWHDDIEFMAVRAGGMVFHVNGASAELTPGMGIMVNSGRLHSCTPLEGFDDCLMVTGLFHPSLLDSKPVRDRGCVDGLIQNDAMPFLVLNGGSAPWQQEALAVLGSLFERVHEPMGELRGVAAFAYLVSLVCQHGVAAAAPSLPRRDRDLDAMKRMLLFIERSYTERVTLAQISEAGMVGQSTCCRLFARFVNMSPVVYLNRYRLWRSTELLRDTDASVTEVALSVGFGGASYYAESFRAWLGMSPSAYRRENGRQGGAGA